MTPHRYYEAFQAWENSPAEGAKVLEESFTRIAEGIRKSSSRFGLNSDQRYVGRTETPHETDVETGTWTYEGSRLTTTSESRNGVPQPSAKSTAYDVKLEADRLSLSSERHVMILRRSDAPVDATLDPRRLKPCEMITAEELAAALGYAVGPGKPSGTSESCKYSQANDPSKAALTIIFNRNPARSADFGSHFKGGERIPDVGDEAYGSAGTLNVRKGTVTLYVSAEGREPASAAATIARILLSRLK